MTDYLVYPGLSIHGNPVLKISNLYQDTESNIRFGKFQDTPNRVTTQGRHLTGIDPAPSGFVDLSGGHTFLKIELPKRRERKNRYWYLDLAKEEVREFEIGRWPIETGSVISGDHYAG